MNKIGCLPAFSQARASEKAVSYTHLDVYKRQAPVKYNLGASVGFEKFVTPSLPRGTDLRNLPVAKAPEQDEKKSRFATRMVNRPSDPSGATDRVTAPGEAPAVDVVSSYRLTKNLDVTAGVRYRADDRVEPLTDSRRDSQAVYVGTAFRF